MGFKAKGSLPAHRINMNKISINNSEKWTKKPPCLKYKGWLEKLWPACFDQLFFQVKPIKNPFKNQRYLLSRLMSPS